MKDKEIATTSFTHVSSVLCSKPQASATSKATRRWAFVVHSHKIAFSSAISATGIALILTLVGSIVDASKLALISLKGFSVRRLTAC